MARWRKRGGRQVCTLSTVLQKKTMEIEKKFLGQGFDHDHMEKWRKKQNDSFSMAVHGSVAAVMVGSWAFSFDSDQVSFPNVFGRASEASNRSVGHLLFQLFYF